MTSVADPVVRTYEVFVSQALNEQLFVLQHPTRPAHLPFTPDQVLSARVKPNQNRVQLDYLVPDTDNSARFCPIKAERMTTGDETERERPSHRLTSEPSLLSGNRYAVAVLKDRSLHLNPLESVVQMRPDVSPLGGSSKKQEETTDETGDIVPLQMKVARSSLNVERTNQRKRERQNQEEAWVPFTYNEFGSGTAGYLRSLLFGDVAEESGGNKPISNEEYLEQLAQVSRQVSRPLPPVAPQSNSLDRQIRNKPIKEQLLHILKNVVGNCVRFSYVHGLLGNQFSAENLLKGLQQVSMLVQGWFVLMSSELYPLPPGDRRTDPLELRRCRDFILCHYSLYKPLDKQDTLRLLALPVEEFNEMFAPVSSFYLRGKHSFKYSEDRLFIRDHLELCRQHSGQWTQVYETIQKHYKLDKPRVTSPLVPDTSEKKRAKSDSGIDPHSVRRLLGNSPMEFVTLKNKVMDLYGKVKQENVEISQLLSDSGMLEEVIHTILKEINAAVIDTKNRTVVVARETDCVTDVYRIALIRCLELKPSQRKQDLVSSFKKSIKSVPPNFDLNEMILNLCDIKGATCAIKGLNS